MSGAVEAAARTVNDVAPAPDLPVTRNGWPPSWTPQPRLLASAVEAHSDSHTFWLAGKPVTLTETFCPP